MSIKDNLKELRKQRGITQGELADIAGIELGQISRIERGASEPKLETIKKLVNALECSADELIMDESSQSDPVYLKALLRKVNSLTPLRRFALIDIIKTYCQQHGASNPTVNELEAEWKNSEEFARGISFEDYRHMTYGWFDKEYTMELDSEMQLTLQLLDELRKKGANLPVLEPD